MKKIKTFLSFISALLALFMLIGSISMFIGDNKNNDAIAGGIFFLILAIIFSIPIIVLKKKKSKETENKEQNNREKYKNKLIDQFNEELESIIKSDIQLSEVKIKNNTISDMPDIKITKPRKGMSLYQFAEFVVIDIETTGLKLTNKIIEVSAIRYEDFEPVQAFTTLLNPNTPIPKEVSQINNITDEMVADSPNFKQIIPALADFIGDSNLLGQNILFDLRFLYKYGYDFTTVNRKYYDTLECAKSKLKRYDQRKDLNEDYYDFDVIDYKLDTLCEYYDILRNNSHRSLSDCLATAKVFKKILENEYELEA